MFELSNIVRFVSLLTYLGFIIGSISGFIEISKKFNLTIMFVCIIVLITNISAIFLHLTNTINQLVGSDKNVLYMSSLFILICSFLTLGLSDIGIVFGSWGIVMSIATYVYGVFLTEDIVTHNLNDEP
jgi:hypothetical protein